MKNLSKLIGPLSKYLFIYLSLVLIVVNVYTSGGEEHYSLLSESFLKGKLYFTKLPLNMGDTVYHDGYFYWPNPVLPAVLLVPFTLILSAFELPTRHVYLVLPVLIVLIILLNKIFKVTSSKEDAFFWTYGFIFSTCFIGVVAISWSWYVAHVLTVFLTFLAYLLYKRGKSFIIIGILYGCIFLTRFTASVGVFFYIFKILQDTGINFKSLGIISRKVTMLLTPLLFAALITLGYNYARFGTWKDLGYMSNNLTPTLEENRSYGVFSLKHIPSNLFYMFLNGPEPIFRSEGTKVLKFPFLKSDPWGMSIFITSPFLLLLFTFDYKKNKEAVLLLVTSIIIMIPILLYFGIGFRQFGYRYSLDFLPYVYLAFVLEYMRKNEKISDRLKVFLMVVSITNLYFFVSSFS